MTKTAPLPWRAGRYLMRSQTEGLRTSADVERVLAYERRMNKRLSSGQWETRVVEEIARPEELLKIEWTAERLRRSDHLCVVCMDPEFPVMAGKRKHKHCAIDPRQIRLPKHLRK